MEDPDVECTAVMPGGADGDFSDARPRRRPRPGAPRDPLGAVRLRRDHPQQRPPRGPRATSTSPGSTSGSAAAGAGSAWSAGRTRSARAGGPTPRSAGCSRSSSTRRPRLGRVARRDPAVADGRDPPDLAHRRRRRRRTGRSSRPCRLPGPQPARPAKPTAEVLARIGPGSPDGEPADRRPALRPGPDDGHGHRRSPAASAGEFTQSWGEGDARYYKKFWRNVVYWLTENSSIGRRRLLAETDKRLYRPGEPIVLKARTFDENAAPTLDYRVAVSVEPRSAADVHLRQLPAPQARRRPDARRRPGPLLPWGEEFDLASSPPRSRTPPPCRSPTAKSLPTGVSLTQGLRIELTAYENNTQVDSTALDVQVLDDPSEQQNPLPDHDLLRRVADDSGGTVLRGAEGPRRDARPAARRRRPARGQGDARLEPLVAARRS